jgi:5-formyltetrahydrofolate cyclo-ligase
VNKAELRQAMRAARAGIDQREERTARLWQAVMADPAWRRATTVMLYVSFGSEPDTSALIDAAISAGKRVLVPRVEQGELAVVDFAPGADVVRSAFGVDEPVGDPVDPQLIDLVVAPGLAFDRSGGRLGYGRGYYDRLLGRLRPGAAVVGACFEEQLVDAVPMGPRDHRLDRVITA